VLHRHSRAAAAATDVGLRCKVAQNATSHSWSGSRAKSASSPTSGIARSKDFRSRAGLGG
jgi:hypothetical protein